MKEGAYHPGKSDGDEVSQHIEDPEADTQRKLSPPKTLQHDYFQLPESSVAT
jgi:hypothetical protein